MDDNYEEEVNADSVDLYNSDNIELPNQESNL